MKLISYLVVGALSVATAGASAQAKQAMTLDDIARTKAVVSAMVSPDGGAIAFVQTDPRIPFEDDDGTAKRQLFVKRGAANPRRYAGGDVSVSNVRWTPDSKAIYYLSKGKDDKQNAIYAIALDGGLPEKVCQLDDERSIGSFDLHSDGQRLAIVAKPAKSEDAKKAKEKGFDAIVYEENVTSATVGLVTPGEDADDCNPEALDVDGHVSSAAFSPDGRRLLLKVAPTPHVDDSYMQTRMRIVNLEGGEVARIGNLGKLGQADWAPNSRQIAFIGVNDFNDPSAGRLKMASARSGEMETVIGEFDGQVESLQWIGTDSVLALVHLGVESELWRVDINSGERTVVVPQGDRVVTAVSVSKDGNTIAVLANSPSHPSELFTVNDGQLQRITNSNPWLADITLGRQEVVNYKAADGLDLQGLVIYPTNYRRGRRYPMIAYVHGGPEAHRSNGWLTNYSSPIQVAAAQGFVAFVPNYRGSTGRGVAFSKAGHHSYATPEFDDIVDGKNHLVEMGLVDKDKVGITGGSYGGYATAWSATALTEHYAAGVMFVGISNQISKFGTTDIPQEMHAVHSRAWPWDDWQWMLERSPIYHVQKSKTPLLIMHGDADPRVHPAQSLEMYRYLKQAGQAPVRLVWYPGEGHGNRRAASQYDYSKRFMRWMSHYLKDNGREPPPYELDYSDKLNGDKDDA